MAPWAGKRTGDVDPDREIVALLAVRLLVQAADQFEADRHLPLLVYVAGIAWLAHIALDRAAGFRLRTPDGWPRDSKPPRH